jgi:hypothetical protein
VNDLWPWLVLFLLGCYHGVNPGMGWLFAVARGLQERSDRAVLSTIPPIALGHVASIASIVVLAGILEWRVPNATIKLAAGALLLAFGAYKLVRVRHPRWVGMRVGFWDLAAWGFLMASAHGAGLMLVPVISVCGPHGTALAATAAAWPMTVAVHTFGYLLVMTLAALLVYRRFGVAFLRTAWINVDAIWAAALVTTGIVAIVT